MLHSIRRVLTIELTATLVTVTAATWTVLPCQQAQAQSAIIYGGLGNFDISNDTGQTCHGFEIELQGVSVDQVPYSFSVERYGAPQVVAAASGVKVRWQSPYDAASGQFAQRTLPHTVPWFPGQCYQWNSATYQDSGCEHFGTGVSVNPSRVLMRWLCPDPNQPGALLAVDPPTPIASPIYTVQPPAQANNPPVLEADVEAPEPAESPELYGDAQWIRVFVRELPRQLQLPELMADNPDVVPMDPAQLEADYAIVQDEPAAGGNGKRRRKRHQHDISPTTRSIIRRIELFRYTGAYDPVTHEALCMDGLCNAPDPSELGELISVQMTAANVEPDAIIVSKSGNGSVDSADKLISCGSKCAQNYSAGQSVKLTVKAASGSSFAGWTGACAASGTQGSCTLTVRGAMDVGASFVTNPGNGGGGNNPTFTLSVRRTNAGTVTSDLPGINCGSSCSSKYASGSVVTLTAVPPQGKTFTGWSNGCSGTQASCVVTLTKDTQVQASFSK